MVSYIGKAPEEIAELYHDRKASYGRMFERLRTVRTLMNNEMPVPLPEISQEERNTVANLALQGMDQIARRVASVMPNSYWPNTANGTEKGKWRAANKPRVINGWAELDRMKLQMAKRSRYFLAYATAPVVVMPNKAAGVPTRRILNPIDTLLPKSTFDDLLPTDFINVAEYTYADLCRTWGKDIVSQVNKPVSWDWDNDYKNMDVKFEVLTYNDEYEYSMHLLGASESSNTYGDPSYDRQACVRLSYAENLCGRPLIVCPGRICLDEQLGQFDGLIGMYQTQAALMALTVIAQRRTVWPTEWLEPFPNSNEEPEVVTIPDPYQGIPGEVHGGTINRQTLDPAFTALEIMDRQEEGMRKEAGIPAEFGGFSATNIRTGKRGGQVMGATIDFTISEAQDIFAASVKEENKLGILIDKTYFNNKKTFFIETRGYVGKVDYKPSDLWDTDAHVVEYPFGGVDLQNIVIEGIQRVASGVMSRETYMSLDPAIADHKAEMQRLYRQGIQDAWLEGIRQLAANPEGPMQIPHLMRLDEKLAKGMEPYEAVAELQAEIQEEQATAAATAAQTQPGLAAPGQGVEQPGESLPEPSPSMNRASQLLSQMATTQTAQRYRQ